MDTRKLKNNGESFIDIGNSDGMVPVEKIITEDVAPNVGDYETLFYAFDEKDAAELVRRWNAHTQLIAELENAKMTLFRDSDRIETAKLGNLQRLYFRLNTFLRA